MDAPHSLLLFLLVCFACCLLMFALRQLFCSRATLVHRLPSSFPETAVQRLSLLPATQWLLKQTMSSSTSQSDEAKSSTLTHLENEAFRVEQALGNVQRQLKLLHLPTPPAPTTVIPVPAAEDLSNDALEERSAAISEALDKVQANVDKLQQQYEATHTTRLERENVELRAKIDEARAALRSLQHARGEAVIDVPNQPSATATAAATATATKVAPKEQKQQKQQKQPKEGKPADAKKKDKKAKKEKAKQAGGKKGGAAAVDKPVDVSRVAFVVGKIVDVGLHPNADALYVEKIDVGEEEPRTIISGLVKFVPIEQMQNRLVVVCSNLKPRKMRDIFSHGMVMCAKADDVIEPLQPPTGAVPGDVVSFDKFPGEPDAQLNPKKKIFEAVQPDFATDANGVATYKGDPFVVKGKGPCVAKVAKNGTVCRQSRKER